MTKAVAGRVGISLRVSADGAHLDEAREIEELGYSTLWLPGGQLDKLERLSELLRATQHIHIAPSIIPVDVYDPAAVTALYRESELRHPGRLLVALGGPQRPRPVAGLNDYLDELDAHPQSPPTSRRILAALGPRKLELARRRAAGAITLLTTPAYTAKARAGTSRHHRHHRRTRLTSAIALPDGRSVRRVMAYVWVVPHGLPRLRRNSPFGP